MQLRHVAWLLAVVPLLVALGAGHPPQAPNDVPSEVAFVWFDQLYDLVKAEQITPPPASRIYGLAAVALYEAVVLGSQTHRPLAGQLNGWPMEMDTLLATAVRALVPPKVGGGVRSPNPPRARHSSVGYSTGPRSRTAPWPAWCRVSSPPSPRALWPRSPRSSRRSPPRAVPACPGRFIPSPSSGAEWSPRPSSPGPPRTGVPHSPTAPTRRPWGLGSGNRRPPPSHRPWSPAGASCARWCWLPLTRVRRRPRRLTRMIWPRRFSHTPGRSTPPT
jgi:hypothetical protein